MDKRKRICLITVSPETSHPQRICRGAFAQCEKYGYDIAQFASMINLDFYFKDFSQAERNIYELIDFSRFDGVILDTISLMSDINMDLARSLYRKVKEQTDIPVICIGIPLEEFETIENSNEEQIREICRHVIEVHGCKDICVLTGPKDNHEAEQRLEILLDEIERHGLSVSDEHRIYGDFWYTSGTNLARDVFNGKISKPDALIAVSDHMALGFIEEYTKLGGKVPEDICVVSFDATPEGMLDDISVTSIESNFAQCAADAVDTIRQVIEPDAEIMPYSSDASSMLRIGMSCGCTPDIRKTLHTIKSSLYFLSRNYNNVVFNDNIDIGLLMETYIPEQLTAATSPENCIELIERMAYIASPFMNFYLCLRDDWLDSSADIIEGYPDKMRMTLIRSNIGDEEFSSPEKSYLFDTSLMLPQMFEERDEPCAFYFSAIHFSDKTLGYAVLQRKLSDYMKFNLVYRNWLRFVNTSLEMARTKNRFVMLSIHDKLTGLLNRRGMYEQIGTLLERLGEDDELIACVIDMDGLKYINDTFGHSDGDYGIKLVGEAALAVTEKDDVCARAGGDEFYVAGIRKKGCFDPDKATEEFCEKLNELSKNDDKPFIVTASIGFASGSGKDTDIEMLLSEADENMYRYKMARKRQRKL